MKDDDWKVLMHSLSLYVQAIPFSKGTSQKEQDAIADHMIGVAEYIEGHSQPPFVTALSEQADAKNDLRAELSKKDLQKYEAAAEYLRAEAKKIPLGEGNVQKGFSSTYNALVFCAEALERASAEKAG